MEERDDDEKGDQHGRYLQVWITVDNSKHLKEEGNQFGAG